MEILENLAEWKADFEQGWLAYYQETGQFDWSRYAKIKNSAAPAGPGLDLSQSRLIFISSAGGYLPASQEPFDAPNALGDYTIRLFPASTPFESIAYAHEHYDHTDVNTDPQVLLPLHHLADLVNEGVIGELAPTVISYSGYQPDASRIVHELIPAILKVARAEHAEAALLVPA